jgi:thiamine biosynthesis lipoprotein
MRQPTLHARSLQSALRAARASRPWLAGLASIVLTLCATVATAEWHEGTESYMGTRVHVEVWSEDATAARAGIAAVMAEMDRIEKMMSPMLESSALSRLNREGATHPVAVPAELFEVVRRSLEVSALSDGAFDVTFASVGRHYDYRAGRRPDAATISSALPAIDYRHLQLDAAASTIAFARAGVYVDLGGIAKGYAVDRGIALLRARGFTEMLVNAGGDTRLVGDRHGKPWVIGIRNPDGGDRPAAVLPLENVAVSTSGDYERFFDEGGTRYHHIIDPKTGDSARAVRSVTIIGDNATWTDALSTTVFVLGAEKGLALVNRLGNVDAVIVDREGRLLYSDSLTDVRPTARAP